MDRPEDWLVAVATGDQRAFAILFEHYAPRVNGWLRRKTRDDDVAEELTQLVMLQVWRRAASFDPTRGSASAWIFTIARNAFLDRARRRRPDVDDHDPALVSDDAPRPDAVAHGHQRAERVRAALRTLPYDQATILHDAYFEGRTLREIAEASDTPLGTIKSRVRLAMGRLRLSLRGLS